MLCYSGSTFVFWFFCNVVGFTFGKTETVLYLYVRCTILAGGWNHTPQARSNIVLEQINSMKHKTTSRTSTTLSLKEGFGFGVKVLIHSRSRSTAGATGTIQTCLHPLLTFQHFIQFIITFSHGKGTSFGGTNVICTLEVTKSFLVSCVRWFGK